MSSRIILLLTATAILRSICKAPNPTKLFLLHHVTIARDLSREAQVE